MALPECESCGEPMEPTESWTPITVHGLLGAFCSMYCADEARRSRMKTPGCLIGAFPPPKRKTPRITYTVSSCDDCPAYVAPSAIIGDGSGSFCALAEGKYVDEARALPPEWCPLRKGAVLVRLEDEQ